MGNAGESAEECMASFCEFELGYGHVAFQVVSRDNPAKFKEQYEVHISGLGSLGQLQEFLGLQQVEILRKRNLSKRSNPLFIDSSLQHGMNPSIRVSEA